MEEKKAVTLEDIQQAAERIRPYVRRTPLLREKSMDEFLGCEVYVKPEMLQITGAFKLRGAMSKIMSLTEEERQRGIITSSSGNHGQACAYAGQLLGIPVTVIVPEDTPHLKVNNARRMGANVILWDRLYVKRWEKVHEEVAAHGYTIVHPYEDPMVMAGQGTIALEVLEDLPELDTIVVPVGGGGLISGISTYIKSVKPSIRVIGIQAEGNDSYVQSRKAGKVVEAPCTPTVADGLSCRRPGNNPFPIIEKNVDELISYRKISFSIIWWSESGLKVPNQAISYEQKGDNQIPYVVRTRIGYEDKIYVKILESNEKYSIVTNYTSTELTELGFTSSEILSLYSISIYDEILINN